MRYCFGDFVLSPARRALTRGGKDVPLIPRYLDLLILLLERRREAVHRREIFDRVWSDVVVSDGALSQAVRTLRRTLGDDPRRPAFISTISRHGYRFVYEGVIEEPDEESPRAEFSPRARPSADAFEDALAILLRPPDPSDPDGDDRREAAETLHTLGTAEALSRLGARPGHSAARALLRDARWDVPGAGDVALWGQPGAFQALWILAGLRLRRGLRIARSRWASASAGGATAGAFAGFAGGAALCLTPGSMTPWTVPVALALLAAIVGGVGGAGVGAGLAVGEATARSWRGVALTVLGALGGGLVGGLAHFLGRWTLEGLFGQDLRAVGGATEGLVIGGACGFGYALATRRPGGGVAAPRGLARLLVGGMTGLTTALGCLVLLGIGGHPVGASVDLIARSFQGSQVGLAPLARWFGETGLGAKTQVWLSIYEGGSFGFGLALGLTRRPKAA
jgi:DNA-binding winged helix-turn-helix (wHTH) protein